MGGKHSNPGHSSLRFDSRLLRGVFRNDIETVEYLISQNADLNIVEHGHGALNIALYLHNKQVAKLLLEAGIDVNNPEVDMPVLTLCAIAGWSSEVELLLTYGADPNQKSKEGSTVLHYLVAQEITCWHNLLLKLVRAGADLNILNQNGDGVLHCIARSYDSAFVSRFMSFPTCDFNLLNREHCTPLMVALRGAKFVTATALVACGCDVNIPDDTGTSPLELAVCYNFMGAVKLLLKHGARVQQACESRYTALHFAATHGNPRILDMLLSQKGIDVNMVNYLGQTALHNAAAKGSLDAMEMLLSHGADPMSLDILRRTPLHSACQLGQNVDAARMLIQLGCPRDPIDSSGKIPLHLAVATGSTELVQALLHHGNANITDNAGRSPLVLAVQHGHLELARMLIEAGALVDLPDSDGHCPLFTAMQFPRMDLAMVQLLLSNDCDPLNLDDMLNWMQANNILEEGVLQKEEMLHAWNIAQRSTPKPLKQFCRLKIQQLMGVGERDRPSDKILKADLPLPICLLDYLCVRMI